MKKFLNNTNKGITLVALIITIILLLILAGIAIGQLMGTGLFEKAKLAKERTEEAEELQNDRLLEYENQIEKAIKGERSNTSINDYREHLICEYNMSKISSNIVSDNSGNNIDGNITGDGLEVKKDTDGRNYIHLDGTTYIKSEEITKLEGNSEKTIMCLFRTNDVTNLGHTMISLGLGDQAKTGISSHIYNGYMRFDTGSHTYLYDPRVVFVADNEWHFTCVTFDGISLVLYLDNKPIFAINANLNITSPELQIGSQNLVGNNTFIGDITDVRVYDKGLNIEEVYAIYSNIKK